MSWIRVISYEEAKGRLKRYYDRIKGPNNVLDNVLTIHSLRPHTLEAHMSLYKSVLHHSGNSLPKWYLETLGTYVSHLNNCNYCVQHHSVGLKKNLNDDEQYQRIMDAIQLGDFNEVLNERYLEGIKYAEMLTLNHSNIKEINIKALRDSGFGDEEVLEINQVVSYFCYVNRTVVGLGVGLEEDNIGLSPNSGGDDDWSHN